MSGWESFETALKIVSMFFAYLGFGFLALCNFFDDRERSPLKRIRPLSRVIIWGILAIFGDFFLLILYVIASVCSPKWPIMFKIEEVMGFAYAAANWPLVLLQWMNGPYSDSNPIPWAVGWWGLLLTGLFWGLVVEASFVLAPRFKRKLRPSSK